MIHNYFKVALRKIQSNKVFSIIMIVGLAIALAISMLLISFYRFETSYDNYHQHANRLFKVNNYVYTEDAAPRPIGCSGLFAPTLKSEIPEIEGVARIHPAFDGATITYQQNSFNEDDVYYADASFLSMFSLQFIGNKQDQLIENENTVIISYSIAQKYFGHEDVTGKIITLNDAYSGIRDCMITGVFQDIPENSHLKFDFLVSIKNILSHDRYARDGWHWKNFTTYVLLKPGITSENLATKLDRFAEQYKPNIRRQAKKIDINLIPVEAIYLQSKYNHIMIYFLLSIAIIILIIAWINYVNIYTAQLLDRRKEIGLKKIVGATSHHILVQLFVETSVFYSLSAVLGIILIELISSPLCRILGLAPSILFRKDMTYWLTFISILLFSTTLSCWFAVISFSSFRIQHMLKGKSFFRTKNFNYRKGLVVFQFAISIFLIIATIIVFNQISFMRNSYLGINISRILVVKGPRINTENSDLRQLKQSFKQELQQHHLVDKACFTRYVPGTHIVASYSIGLQNSDNRLITVRNWIDHEFVDVFEHQIIAGRNYSENPSENTGRTLINEELALSLGFTDVSKAIGQVVELRNNQYEIIGVVKNYHHESLKQAIYPIIYHYGIISRGFYAIKLKFLQPDVMKFIADKWNTFFPGNPFDYSFLDESFDQQYKKDIVIGRIFLLSATIAIIIACLGLFGLSLYDSINRTKEIGIRKVVGAATHHLVVLMTKDVAKWILISNLVAWPVAYYVMNNWLQNFAYRVGINIWPFLLAGFAALMIALLTVSWQALKTATANPVESLRYE